MVPTQVGMRCPECAGGGRRVVPRLAIDRSRPIATQLLIAVNLVAFLGEQGQFTIYGSSIHGALIEEGILYRQAIAVQHQYWRLLTSAFLHENILHILFNMYLLYLVGRMIEPVLGPLRLTVIYLTALLAGSFGALFATNAATLGASGAVFGLMGAAAFELRARGISVMESGIGGLIVLNLVFSFLVPNISYGAHVGGLIGGALAAWALHAAGRRRLAPLGYLACLGLCALSVAGAIAAAQATGPGLA